jgi:MFS family permease
LRLLISFASLFLSVIFVQLGSGALAPLDALSGAAKGFTASEIGLLGSAHFVGFFIGCWFAPRMMGNIGHGRTFAAFAAGGAIGALAHPLHYDPYFWALMRIFTGMAVAGAYTVVESWMHAKATNANRGRVLGVYRMVDLTGSLGAQVMIAVLPPASYVSYNILAILCCLCVLPLTLTRSEAPPTPEAPRLSPIRAIRLSPLAAFGVVVVGLTNSSFRMVGPVYGQEMGLAAGQIGLFLAAAVLGGAVAQLPVGWLADRYDRRKVLIGLSFAAIAVCAAIMLGFGGGATAIYATSFAFGLVAFPIYSVSTAHANDFATPEFVVELNASLMFLYGVGAIVSPIAAATLIQNFGPSALFAYISVAHVALIGFGFWRMRARGTAEEKTPYRYVPRTSFTLGRLFRRNGGRR